MIIRQLFYRSLAFILPFTSLSLEMLNVSASNSNSYDVPYNSCATMQAYFNSLNWDNKVSFRGFENRVFDSKTNYRGATSNICSGGYITDTSPLGRLLCYGYIYQIPVERDGRLKPSYYWSHGYNSDSTKGDHCRWQD
jgi:hypothetical protein